MTNKRLNSIGVDGRYAYAFQKFWALAAFCLIGATWQLWLPVTDFPMVPVFEPLTQVPTWLDPLLLGLMSIGLAAVLLSSRAIVTKTGLLLFAAAMLGMVLLDQHRLQPWAYQFFVCAIVMAFCPRREAWRLMGWVTISIYFYSALSKFDYQFTETLGRDFLKISTDFVGIDTTNWTSQLISRFVLLFPAIELLLAIGLTIGGTRKIAGWGIALLHLSLILILGPWGLQHQWGVLTWNVFLLGQAIFLFCFSDRRFNDHFASESQPSTRRTPARWIANLWVGFVLVFPLTTAVDICDHWLAWEVYAPRTSRAKLEFPEAEVESLPPKLQELCFNAPDQIGTVEFRLDQWSLQTLGVPIYPEDRFQFAVGRELIRRFGIQNFRLSVGAESNRWNGERKWKVVDRTEKVEIAAAEFWLNTTARQVARPLRVEFQP